MQDKSLYKIIFEGQIKAGEDFNQVKARLASLFKVDILAIEKIFRDAPTIIQRLPDEEKALKYKEAVERNGALCRIEKELPPSPPGDIPQSQHTLYSPQTPVYTQVAEPIKDIPRGFNGLTGKHGNLWE